MATSVSPVLLATALAWAHGVVHWGVAALCFFFALLAQIASNFGNDYFDYRKGSDKADRVGPRRAVAAGDISPRAMLVATAATLGVACLLGCLLIPVGGWWLIGVGVIIAAAALAYSACPYPLSYHGLGDLTGMDILRPCGRQPLLLRAGLVVRQRRLPVQRRHWVAVGQHTDCKQLPRCRRRPCCRQTHDSRALWPQNCAHGLSH